MADATREEPKNDACRSFAPKASAPHVCLYCDRPVNWHPGWVEPKRKAPEARPTPTREELLTTVEVLRRALKVQRDALYIIREKQHGNVSTVDLNHGIALIDAALTSPPVEQVRAEWERLTKAVDHWKTSTGFDTPEELNAAINARFEKELPKGLAKSLWLLEYKCAAELREQLAAETARADKAEAKVARLRAAINTAIAATSQCTCPDDHSDDPCLFHEWAYLVQMLKDALKGDGDE